MPSLVRCVCRVVSNLFGLGAPAVAGIKSWAAHETGGDSEATWADFATAGANPTTWADLET